MLQIHVISFFYFSPEIVFLKYLVSLLRLCAFSAMEWTQIYFFHRLSFSMSTPY